MITDADVEKLKDTFATKDDLKAFATKDDLKAFATKDDLKAFATKDDLKAFATKDDLKAFATKDDLKASATKDDLKAFASKEDLADLKLEVGDIKDTVNRIEVTLDTVAGAIHDLRLENTMGNAHLERHDRQIAALASHTGAVLPD
jgi:hypothetical protein